MTNLVIIDGIEPTKLRHAENHFYLAKINLSILHRL